MTITYKILEKIIKLLKVKKIFIKSKEDILEYAKKENNKVIFNIDKSTKIANRKKYYLFDKEVDGYRLLLYQKSKKPAVGAVFYLFGGGMITGPNQLDFPLAERIMQKIDKDVWFLFYPLCSATENVRKTYEICFKTYKKMTKIYKAKNINVLGFSSGACLSIGVFLHNNALGAPLPMPGKIISVSPGALPDLNLDENKTLWKKLNAVNYKDIMIDPTYFKTAREILKGSESLPEYMLDGTCGDFSNFPKIYFYYGENECLYTFAEYFKKAIEKYNVPYKIIVGKGMCHCYPMARFFKEGRLAQDEIIELLNN